MEKSIHFDYTQFGTGAIMTFEDDGKNIFKFKVIKFSDEVDAYDAELITDNSNVNGSYVPGFRVNVPTIYLDLLSTLIKLELDASLIKIEQPEEGINLFPEFLNEKVVPIN